MISKIMTIIVDDDFLNKLYETEEQRAKEIYNKFNEEDI